MTLKKLLRVCNVPRRHWTEIKLWPFWRKHEHSFVHLPFEGALPLSWVEPLAPFREHRKLSFVRISWRKHTGVCFPSAWKQHPVAVRNPMCILTPPSSLSSGGHSSYVCTFVHIQGHLYFTVKKETTILTLSLRTSGEMGQCSKISKIAHLKISCTHRPSGDLV